MSTGDCNYDLITEEYVKELKKKDRERDSTLTDSESAKWNFTLWHEPLLRCFPEVDMNKGPAVNSVDICENRRTLAGEVLVEPGHRAGTGGWMDRNP